MASKNGERDGGERERAKWPLGVSAVVKPWRSVNKQAGCCCWINPVYQAWSIASVLVAMCTHSAAWSPLPCVPKSLPPVSLLMLYNVCIVQDVAGIFRLCFWIKLYITLVSWFSFSLDESTRLNNCHFVILADTLFCLTDHMYFKNLKHM